MNSDRGSITIWILGLAMVVLAIGGLALDLWRVLDEKHRVEFIADSAAVSGASVIDEGRYRATGETWLDPGRARDRAGQVIAAAGAVESVAIGADTTGITVVIAQGVELSLLKLLLPGEGRIIVQGRATGSPQRHP